MSHDEWNDEYDDDHDFDGHDSDDDSIETLPCPNCGAVFVYRGFGIAAGTHAMYDIIVS